MIIPVRFGLVKCENLFCECRLIVFLKVARAATSPPCESALLICASGTGLSSGENPYREP